MSMRTNKCSHIAQFCVIVLPSVFLSACVGIYDTVKSISSAANNTEITPIMPYQAGDENLNCAELNKEIGRAQEKMSRLIEQNEKTELAEEESRSFVTHLVRWGYFSVISYPISAAYNAASTADEEKYGTEDGQLVQVYQERVKHLESIGKSKGC